MGAHDLEPAASLLATGELPPPPPPTRQSGWLHHMQSVCVWREPSSLCGATAFRRPRWPHWPPARHTRSGRLASSCDTIVVVVKVVVGGAGTVVADVVIVVVVGWQRGAARRVQLISTLRFGGANNEDKFDNLASPIETT